MPKHHNVHPTPNGLAMFKLQCVGEVTTVCAPLSSLAPALQLVLEKDKLPLQDVKDKLCNLTIQEAHHLKENDATLFRAMQKAGDVLFIPPGFIHAEICISGVLIYGLRKSVFVLSDGGDDADARDIPAAANYEALIGCLENEGSSTENYKTALEQMAGTAAEGE